MPLSTENYEMFKKHPSNRDLQESNVASIMKSISSRNLLFLRPILVDKNMRVMDGQHRLEAAKRLGLEIFYEIGENVETKDIVRLNANQRPWSGPDYLNYFVKEGQQEYVKLYNYMVRNGLTFRNCVSLISGKSTAGNGGDFYNSFKSGSYKFPTAEKLVEIDLNLSRIKEVISYVKEKTMGNRKFTESTSFMISIILFLNVKEVNFDIFMKKISMKLDYIVQHGKIKGYVNMWREIYNYGSRNHISIDAIT